MVHLVEAADDLSITMPKRQPTPQNGADKTSALDEAISLVRSMRAPARNRPPRDDRALRTFRTPLKIHMLNAEVGEGVPKYQKRRRKPKRDLPKVVTPNIVMLVGGVAFCVALVVGALLANLGWHPPVG